MPRIQNFGLAPGQVPLLSTTVTLTAAQIQALNVTVVTLVPAPGAGKIIVPFGYAMAYLPATFPFLVPTGGTDQLIPIFSFGGFSTGVFCVGLLSQVRGSLFYSGASFGPLLILPGLDNVALLIKSLSPYTNGPIVTATLGAGGAGYVANDTGTVSTGSADATYKVLTVGGGGAVLTFQITGAGTSYATANGVATVDGGAQPGVGAGFTVNITAVQPGDGTVKVVTYYQIVPVP
jgi:hypothetical protein